jgi:hypothetical protein
VGTSQDELKGWMNKNGIHKEFIEQFEALEWEDGSKGKAWEEDGRSILWLRHWRENWDDYETLMHETLHLIQFILMEGKSMSKEWEAQAYQQEFLFREIGRKLTIKLHDRRK